MKFSEAPEFCYFVVIDPDTPSILLSKAAGGEIRTFFDYRPYSTERITSDTEVQIVILKPQPN